MNSFYELTLVLSYSMQKFAKIECHLHGKKNRSTFQNPDHPVVLADIDDVTVTLSLIVLSRTFFTNSPWYYLTPHQNLLRLNVIFMVRKIGKKEVQGGGCHPPPAPSLCLILEPRRLARSE